MSWLGERGAGLEWAKRSDEVLCIERCDSSRSLAKGELPCHHAPSTRPETAGSSL